MKKSDNIRRAAARAGSREMKGVKGTSDARIGALAAGVAHDLNSVLTLIYGYGEMALENLQQRSEAEENIRRIIRATDRARELTAQLLEMGRRATLDRKPVRVDEVLNDTIDHIKPSIPKGITVSSCIEARGAAVLVPPAQLFRVILNILLNAVQAIGEKEGKVIATVTRTAEGTDGDEKGESDEREVRNVSGESEGRNVSDGSDGAEGRYVLISFRDTGKGMDAKGERAKFRPFYTTGDQKRTGLGLTVVSDLVREMGGVIRITSAVDEGTTVEVSIPEMKAGKSGTGERK